MVINIPEVLVAEGVGICVLVFLLQNRWRNKESLRPGERYFTCVLVLTLIACISEGLTFVLDGVQYPFSKWILFLLNTVLYVVSSSVGYLWCMYTDFRLFHNMQRLQKRRKWLILPLIGDWVLLVLNFFIDGLVFSVSAESIYSRGPLMPLTFAVLFFYMFFSIASVYTAKFHGVSVRFYPVFYFVLPCIIGTLLQSIFYGIATGWLSVSIATLFVNIQLQNMDSYSDGLSGLFNRRYMDYLLSSMKPEGNKRLYGLMFDINDFKQINDRLGHVKGDEAIRTIGRILLKTASQDATAIRYAGDEFVVLYHGTDESAITQIMEQINDHIEKYNSEGRFELPISISTGFSCFDPATQTPDEFLQTIDREMYAAKARYYAQSGKDRRTYL